jgi:hypothetical protein
VATSGRRRAPAGARDGEEIGEGKAREEAASEGKEAGKSGHCRGEERESGEA